MQLYSELLEKNIDFPETGSSPHEILEQVIRYETNAKFDYVPFICDSVRVSVCCKIWDESGRTEKGYGEASEANLKNSIAKMYPVKMALKRAFDDAAIHYLRLPAKDYRLLFEMEEQQSNMPAEDKGATQPQGVCAQGTQARAVQPAKEQAQQPTRYEDTVITIGRQKGKGYTVAQLAEKDMDSLLYIAYTFPQQVNPISSQRKVQVDACLRWIKEHGCGPKGNAA